MHDILTIPLGMKIATGKRKISHLCRCCFETCRVYGQNSCPRQRGSPCRNRLPNKIICTIPYPLLVPAYTWVATYFRMSCDSRDKRWHNLDCNLKWVNTPMLDKLEKLHFDECWVWRNVASPMFRAEHHGLRNSYSILWPVRQNWWRNHCSV